ncbi:hypothetical protein Pint_00069 [Pistacia integerrima]|uniref:Uncharacterized protein n=1 Tax=Pistacia integerrima TaxID=434235 RepID=A0ACC0ZPH8_9ROSI|nr:hypothetical protein Pint_00069 [Pistacia integerrima]
MERDSPSDTRNTLLVVAAPIATVTFQAGINPPSRFILDTLAANPTNTANSAAANPIKTANSGPPTSFYRLIPAVTSGLAVVSGIHYVKPAGAIKHMYVRAVLAF